jgi:hypothetical protein
MDFQEVQRLEPEIDIAINKFFKDKYSVTDLEMISEDLIFMIRNEYIARIYFCLYDKNSIQGIVFSFDYSGNSSLRNSEKETINFDNFNLKLGNEKLLILELSEKFINLPENKKNEIINERKNIWNFLGNQDIKIPSYQNIYYSSESIKIKYCEIR